MTSKSTAFIRNYVLNLNTLLRVRNKREQTWTNIQDIR